jgi:hypothetical protein
VKSVFISLNTKDDKVVDDIRGALQGKLRVWDDSQWRVGGDSPDYTLEDAVDESPYFMALLSFCAVNSPRVNARVWIALDLYVSASSDNGRIASAMANQVCPIESGATITCNNATEIPGVAPMLDKSSKI